MLNCEEKDPNMENRPYRSLAGSLLYVATGARPDIAFAVGRLSRHLKKPSEEHWNAAIRVLRYLKSTATHGICYRSKPGGLKLSAFSNTDWGSDKDNRHSTSGVMVMVNDSLVIFKSKLQSSVSLSTAEAECVALSLCIHDIMCTKSLLMKMKVKIDAPVIVYEDNQSGIAIAKIKGCQSRARHIDIRYYFVRDRVKAKMIQLEHIETKFQLADFLTKAISTSKFQSLVAKTSVGDF
uniref:Polyprotein n=1 Tax=Peronospora matthiolae TaxID=2874970 RepID=A0AAV1VEY0_9STRA